MSWGGLLEGAVMGGRGVGEGMSGPWGWRAGVACVAALQLRGQEVARGAFCRPDMTWAPLCAVCGVCGRSRA